MLRLGPELAPSHLELAQARNIPLTIGEVEEGAAPRIRRILTERTCRFAQIVKLLHLALLQRGAWDGGPADPGNLMGSPSHRRWSKLTSSNELGRSLLHKSRSGSPRQAHMWAFVANYGKGYPSAAFRLVRIISAEED